MNSAHIQNPVGFQPTTHEPAAFRRQSVSVYKNSAFVIVWLGECDNTRAHRVAETRKIADRARHYGASPKDAVQIGRHHQQEVSKASTSNLRRNLEQAVPATNKWQMPGKVIRHEAEARELTRRGVGIPAKYSGKKTKAAKIASETK